MESPKISFRPSPRLADALATAPGALRDPAVRARLGVDPEAELDTPSRILRLALERLLDDLRHGARRDGAPPTTTPDLDAQIATTLAEIEACNVGDNPADPAAGIRHAGLMARLYSLKVLRAEARNEPTTALTGLDLEWRKQQVRLEKIRCEVDFERVMRVLEERDRDSAEFAEMAAVSPRPVFDFVDDYESYNADAVCEAAIDFARGKITGNVLRERIDAARTSITHNE